ncbi:hypothetical protein [Lentibacter sp. XHP0401]|jgi:hypothetical protein|uniref:hypothetical protein n=1 Tax=Lentibacter sp. XHP0401 TaxID=2984334 RepID=UPI0021E8782A|nr:hypothetical protein [Lentibacter sp. XHP0401]MCV2893069.1 hypothetical protein [Lentibacter sp. XHP0401]
MKLALNTIAAFALTTTTAFAMSTGGPSMDGVSKPSERTSGEVVTIQSNDFNSKREGREATNGTVQATLFEGSDKIDTTPGGAHFR